MNSGRKGLDRWLLFLCKKCKMKMENLDDQRGFNASTFGAVVVAESVVELNVREIIEQRKY